MKNFIFLVLILISSISVFCQRRALNKIYDRKIEHSKKGIDSFRRIGVSTDSSIEMNADTLDFRPGLIVKFHLTAKIHHYYKLDGGTGEGFVTIKNTRSKNDIHGVYSIIGTPVFKVKGQEAISTCSWRVVIENNLPILKVRGVDQKKINLLRASKKLKIIKTTDKNMVAWVIEENATL